MEPKSAAPRFSLHLPMRYRRQGDLRWREVITKNVSSTGALFLAPEALKPGSKLEIEIVMTAGLLKPSRVTAESEVVRQSSEEEPLLTSVRHLRYSMHQEDETPEWVAGK
jgi:hypothetical protein